MSTAPGRVTWPMIGSSLTGESYWRSCTRRLDCGGRGSFDQPMPSASDHVTRGTDEEKSRKAPRGQITELHNYFDLQKLD